MFRTFLLLSIIAFAMVSCKKTDTNPDFSAIDKQLIEEYISVKGLTAQSTSSGLYYVITAPGNSNHPLSNSLISANYKGYLLNGTVFDQSASGKPLSFALNQVIRGWQEGLQLIGVGGKIKLLVPSALGYANKAVGSIPANSVLIFDVELVSVTSNK